MKRSIGLVGILLVVPALIMGSRPASSHRSAASASDAARIDGLLNELTVTDIESLPALPVTAFALPSASADVMRVRLNETYQVYGVGMDTVDLTTWLPVTHHTPRPPPAQPNLTF